MTDRESPYNGIETPPVWPPQHIETDSAPLAVPYLNNSPPVIPIDTGRQLFVDDFLIEHSRYVGFIIRPNHTSPR